MTKKLAETGSLVNRTLVNRLNMQPNNPPDPKRDAKTLVQGWPITVEIYDSGEVAFVSRPLLNGKRQNRSFSTQKWGTMAEAAKMAVNFCKTAKQVEKTEKVSAYPIPLNLRPRLEFYIHEIQEAGLDPIEALKLGFETLKEQREISLITFNDAVEQVIQWKWTETRAEKYISNLKIQYAAFGREFGDRKLSEITAAEIEDFLADRDINSVSWNNWKTLLSILWNFALLPRNKWVKVNVVEQIATKSAQDKEVTAFTVPQAKQVLAAANAELPRLLPFLVLGMFCGLRISEIERASWEDINWETNTVHAGKFKRKNSMANRHVTIAPAGLAWLERCRKESGPFIETGESGRRADLNKLRELTFDFDPNIFRHTFGSFHNEAFKNSPLTAQEMGHTSVQMIAKHYRKPIPKLVALGFWNLTPEAVLHNP